MFIAHGRIRLSHSVSAIFIAHRRIEAPHKPREPWFGATKHGTPNGVRGFAVSWSIDISLLTECGRLYSWSIDISLLTEWASEGHHRQL
jgi:hypothetical protein